jgi:creatinine amidohydrolase
MSGILEEMTIDDVRAFEPEVVVLGVASTEPHGPVLPYGTDYWQCDAICRRGVTRANERGARALMYPTLPIGNNVNFKPFPFACRVRVRTLMLMLLDIIEALEEDGIRKIVLVDGHGGNTDSEQAALREHFDRTPPERRAFVCMTRCKPSDEARALIRHPSDHGGESETSRMMYLRPELVRTDKLQDLPVGVPFVESVARGEVHYVRPWHLHVPLGGGGDCREATAEKGRLWTQSAADWLADLLVELSQAPWNPNFPYPPDKD